MLLALPEPDPDVEPAVGAEAGAAGLLEGAAGPFPEDFGGGDRGRFLKGRKAKGEVSLGC